MRKKKKRSKQYTSYEEYCKDMYPIPMSGKSMIDDDPFTVGKNLVEKFLKEHGGLLSKSNK